MSEYNMPKATIDYNRECKHCEYTDIGKAVSAECPECGGRLYITTLAEDPG